MKNVVWHIQGDNQIQTAYSNGYVLHILKINSAIDESITKKKKEKTDYHSYLMVCILDKKLS